MPLGNPTGGFGYAAEFQSSAIPWVSSSVAGSTPVQVPFNYITRFISLTNMGASATNNLKIGFTVNGVNGSNYATVAPGQTLTLEWRCAAIWLASSAGTQPFSLAVGLTTIPAGQMPILSGSGPDGSNWQGVG